MSEAKADDLPPIDKDAAAARKARQARLDAIEDAKAEKDKAINEAKKATESGEKLTDKEKEIVAEILIEKALESGQTITAGTRATRKEKCVYRQTRRELGQKRKVPQQTAGD